ncbi:MAG TPA: dTMP kinase [Gaiellaceae bacterium]|nr:dTMP kinase [Gaiellaceae bacterium]
MAARGRLITIEGIDGAGKTTLAGGLAAALHQRGIDVLALREPGGVALAEGIRALVMDPAHEVAPRTEALLYAAARAQLVAEQLEPALAAGRFVLLDRFVDSSLAYQGAGRGLGVPAIARLNEFATGGLRPDRTLLLAIDPAVGRARRGAQADRIELEDDAFFARIDAAYRSLALADPQRVRVLNATLPPRELLADAVVELADLLHR